MTNIIERTGTGSIDRTGTGTIERTGTGSIERTGTGSIERTGTGSIERTGTGRIARQLALSVAFACAFSGAAVAETASYDTSRGTIDIHSSGGEVRVSWHYDDGVNRQFLVGAGSINGDYSLIKLKPVEAFKIFNDGTADGSAYLPGATADADRGQFGETGEPASFQKIFNDGTADGSAYLPGATADADRGQFGETGEPVSFQKIFNDGTADGAAYLPGATADADRGQFGETGEPASFQKIFNDGTADGSSIDMELIFTPEGVEAVATMGAAYTEAESVVLDLHNDAEFAEAVVFVGTASF